MFTPTREGLAKEPGGVDVSKHRRSVTLDPDVDDYLDGDGVNASDLVNSLLKRHMTAGGNREAMLELRAEQIRSEITELEGRVETKRQELEQVEADLEDLRDDRVDVFDRAAEALTERDLLDNTAKVDYWADQADVKGERLISEVQDRIQ